MRIEPMPQGFGAEVADFDLLEGRAADDVARLQAEFQRHHLYVFRGGSPIPPERQLEITGWFGSVGVNQGSDGKPWTVLDNAEPEGSHQLPFHTDISFMEHPLGGISLHPLALPAGETSTTYVSNAVGWDALPPETQAFLRGRTVQHYYANGADMAMDWPVFEYWHPACLPHPVSGRPLLYVTEHHVEQIERMDAAAGSALLQDLFAVLYAPQRRYEHIWRAGDLVLWDNFAVQHARTQAADPGEGQRILQRVSWGKAGFAEQLEKLLSAQQEMAG
jgi:taurine dioxygenase